MKVGKPTIVVDSAGLMQYARENLPDKIHAAGEEVAESVRQKVPEDVEVVVNDHINENGRPVSVVTIAHASGLARQARDGVLTRSVLENGYDVTEYPERDT